MTPSNSAVPLWFAVEPRVRTKRGLADQFGRWIDPAPGGSRFRATGRAEARPSNRERNVLRDLVGKAATRVNAPVRRGRSPSGSLRGDSPLSGPSGPAVPPPRARRGDASDTSRLCESPAHPGYPRGADVVDGAKAAERGLRDRGLQARKKPRGRPTSCRTCWPPRPRGRCHSGPVVEDAPYFQRASAAGPLAAQLARGLQQDEQADDEVPRRPSTGRHFSASSSGAGGRGVQSCPRLTERPSHQLQSIG